MVNIIYMDGDGHKKARPVTNREEYVAQRNAAENVKNFYDARSGNEQAKKEQVQYCYNDLLPDGVLKGCCHPSSTFAHDIDCGSAEEQQRIKEVLLAKREEIGLLELSGSARYGLHAVCRRPQGKTIREAQYALSMATQTEYDTNARGLARVLFTGPATADNLFFLDDALFEEQLSVEESAKEYELLKQREARNEEEVAPGAKKSDKHYRPWEEEMANVKGKMEDVTAEPSDVSPQPSGKQFPTHYHGIPFADILKKYWEVNNNGFEPTEGDRDTLTFQLASDLRHICGKSFEWLDQVIPCYDGFPLEEKRQKIRNALASKYEGMPTRLKATLDQLPSGKKNVAKPLVQCKMEEPQSELSKVFASNRPPEVPAVLPKLVKAATRCTPKVFLGTVAQAIFPALATYPRMLSFRYTDNLPRELRINCLIVAGSGSGKNKSTDSPIAHILPDLKQRDEINRERLKKFNEDYNAKAGNKQKPQRPSDLIIQTIKSDITKAALVQRMDEAQCAPLYVKLNELEQWDKIEGVSGRSNQFTTLKICDDEGNDFGTDRAGTQSVTGSGSLHLNWNANTTPSKVIRYFRYVLTDGPISRLCLATIPEREIGADMPVFGEYDAEYDKALKPFIDNLKKATGYIDCVQARKLAKSLKEECAEFARLSQDKVFDELSGRALAAVFRKACLLYAANGMKWEKAIESFCRWSLFYDLYLKMSLWGDQIRHADDDIPTSKPGPRSLLELLPAEFTIEDAKRVREQQGLNKDKANKMVSQWKSRGYILQLTVDSYKKAPKQQKEKE